MLTIKDIVPALGHGSPLGSLQRRGRRGATVAAIAAQLADVRGRIAGLNRDAEPRFVAIGEQFLNLQQDSVALAGMVDRTAGLLDRGSPGNIVGGLESLLAHTFAGLRRQQESLREVADRVGGMAGAIGRIRGLMDRGDRVVLATQAVATSIAVESAADRESQELFHDFALGIRQLVGRIRELFADIDSFCAAKEAAIAAAGREMRGDLALVAGVLERAESAVRAASAGVGDVSASSRDVLVQVREQAARLRERSEEIVVGLQFNDITRQQLEHVASALASLDARNDDAGDILAAVSIQQAQLQQVATTMADSRRRIEGAIQDVARGNGLLTNATGRIAALNRDEIADRSPIDQLQVALDDLEQICRHGERLNEQARAAADRAAQNAVQLTDTSAQVHRISEELRLQALNAVIKSARLGAKGRALETLAREVTAVATQTGDLAGQIVAAIAEVSRLGEEVTAVGTHEAEFGPGDGPSIHGLMGAIGEVRDNFAAAHQRAGRLSSVCEQTVPQFGAALDDLEQQLAGVQSALATAADLIREIGTVVPATSHGPDPDGDLYTMEIEREIHRSVVAASGARVQRGSAATVVGPTATAATASDLGDNVELF